MIFDVGNTSHTFHSRLNFLLLVLTLDCPAQRYFSAFHIKSYLREKRRQGGIGPQFLDDLLAERAICFSRGLDLSARARLISIVDSARALLIGRRAQILIGRRCAALIGQRGIALN